MNDLARNDWQTLRFSPLWVFSAVVGSYRHFHPLAQAAFWQSVDDAAYRADGLAQEVLVSLTADRDRLVREYEQDGRPVVSGLRAVVNVLATVPPAESAVFKALLLSQIGEGVARARGAFGQTISRDDAETLALLAELLEVDTAEATPFDVRLPV